MGMVKEITIMNGFKRDIDLSFKFAYDRTIFQQTLDKQTSNKEDLVDYIINKM